jgi:hypothetical protein
MPAKTKLTPTKTLTVSDPVVIPLPTKPHTSGRPHIAVVRKELSDLLKVKYLAALEQCGLRTKACRQVGINYFLPTLWELRSPTFRQAHTASQDLGSQYLLDQLAEHGVDLALNGWQRPIYQRGQLVGHETYHSPALIEAILDRCARRNWAQSINAVNIATAGPAAIQIVLGSNKKTEELPNPSE